MHNSPSTDGIVGDALTDDITIGQALTIAAKLLKLSETSRLDARVLMKHVLAADDGGLIARANEALPKPQARHFADLIERRAAGEPVAYITGTKEFWSLNFQVTPDVLIPRDDSECIIEAVIQRRPADSRLRILDLGTGSGCLLCALLSSFPNSQGRGIDRSEPALKIAAANAASLGFSARTDFIAGDWFDPIAGKFDVIVANPPYIRDGDRPGLPRDVSQFEPSEALFGGPDGLNPYRTIIAQLGDYLAPDGLFVCEIGADQGAAVKGLITQESGLPTPFLIKDLAGRDRGVGADRGRT